MRLARWLLVVPLLAGCNDCLAKKPSDPPAETKAVASAPTSASASASANAPMPSMTAAPAGPPDAASAECSEPPDREEKLAKSHDGKAIAWDGGGKLCFRREGRTKILLVDREERGDAGVEDRLSGFDDISFSRDDRVIFFSTSAWAVSSAAHGVEVATGKEWFIVDGSVSEIESGPYKGSLLGTHFRLDDQHEIGSPGYTGRGIVQTVVDWNGKKIIRLPDEERERRKVLYGK